MWQQARQAISDAAVARRAFLAHGTRAGRAGSSPAARSGHLPARPPSLRLPSLPAASDSSPTMASHRPGAVVEAGLLDLDDALLLKCCSHLLPLPDLFHVAASCRVSA